MPAKRDLSSRYTQEQKPILPVQHKCRTEAEIRKALVDYVTGKPLLRDDEREEILEDAITELIATRKILMDMTQRLGMLHTDVTTDMKHIFS